MQAQAIINATSAISINTFAKKPMLYWGLLACMNCSAIERITVFHSGESLELPIPPSHKVKLIGRTLADATPGRLRTALSIENFNEQAPLIMLNGGFPFIRSEDLIRALDQVKSGQPVVSGYRSTKSTWAEDASGAWTLSDTFTGNNGFWVYPNSVTWVKHPVPLSPVFHEMKRYPDPGTSPQQTTLDEWQWSLAEAYFIHHFPHTRSFPDIKLFITDVDGVLTDAGMYYTEKGDELKKFNTHDGKGLELLRKAGLKTAIITSENTRIVANRARKLKINHVYQGKTGHSKLDSAKEICRMVGVRLEETAYVGDDVNCFELLSNVGLAACPANALPRIKRIPGILHLSKSGGQGAVREFAEYLLSHILS